MHLDQYWRELARVGWRAWHLLLLVVALINVRVFGAVLPACWRSTPAPEKVWHLDRLCAFADGLGLRSGRGGQCISHHLFLEVSSQASHDYSLLLSHRDTWERRGVMSAGRKRRRSASPPPDSTRITPYMSPYRKRRDPSASVKVQWSDWTSVEVAGYLRDERFAEDVCKTFEGLYFKMEGENINKKYWRSTRPGRLTITKVMVHLPRLCYRESHTLAVLPARHTLSRSNDRSVNT